MLTVLWTTKDKKGEIVFYTEVPAEVPPETVVMRTLAVTGNEVEPTVLIEMTETQRATIH